LQVLKSKLWQMEQERINKELVQERRQQIGTQERSEKIRTYNFPQNRVTDHRLNKSWYNLEDIMDGELDIIIKEFEKQKVQI
jgi:bacterial peptide chain release factor 1 (bRF-1)